MRKWLLNNSRFLACLGWVTVGTVLIIKILLQGAKRSVYPLFLCGGNHWCDGLSVYTGECENFQYWPGFAAFMSFFSKLPYTLGTYLWTALNLFVLILALYQFLKTYRNNDNGKYSWLALLLAIPMSLEGLINQQSNPLLAGLVLLGVAFAGQKRWWLASVFLLLPGLTKVAPMCFALLVLAVYPKELWWRMIVVGVVLALLPFGLQNPEYVLSQYKEWFSVLGGEAGERWAYRDAYVWYELLTMGHISNHDKVADMGWYRFVQLASAGFAFCITAGAVYLRKFDRQLAGALAFSWGAWWLVLFGPSTEVATCVMGAGAAAWCLIQSIGKRGFICMLVAFVLLCIGSSGEIEFELGQTFGDWNKGLLSLGAMIWGFWLVYYSMLSSQCDEKGSDVMRETI